MSFKETVKQEVKDRVDLFGLARTTSTDLVDDLADEIAEDLLDDLLDLVKDLAVEKLVDRVEEDLADMIKEGVVS